MAAKEKINLLDVIPCRSEHITVEIGVFRDRKLKTDFHSVNPTWEQIKNISEII